MHIHVYGVIIIGIIISIIIVGSGSGACMVAELGRTTALFTTEYGVYGGEVITARSICR